MESLLSQEYFRPKCIRVEVKTHQESGQFRRMTRQIGKYDIAAFVHKDGTVFYRRHSDIVDAERPLDSAYRNDVEMPEPSAPSPFSDDVLLTTQGTKQ